MVHTPHRDKARRHVAHHGRAEGARLSTRHAASSTTTTRRPFREVLDRGYWAAFSIYPQTKMGKRADGRCSSRTYGPERIIVEFRLRLGRVGSARVAKTARLMAQRGIAPMPSSGGLRQRAGRLRPERRDEGGALARAAGDRPAHALRGQLGAARRADAAHRAAWTFRGRVVH